MKRLMLLCLTMVLSIVAWAYDFEDFGIYYNIVDGGVEVTWGGNTEESGTISYSEAMVIPNEVEYGDVTYAVVGIGSYAFYGDKITSIELPETITYIDSYAFYDCYLLESINISAAVTTIGNHAFHFCARLTDIGTLESVVTIGTYGFYSCSSLTNVDTLKKVTSIGNSCFSYCSKLESIKLPKSLTSIGEYVFRECYSLEEITFPIGVTELPESALRECTALTTVTLPENLGSIGTYCFRGCKALTNITSKNPSAPTVSNTNAFTDVNKDTCIIYVPIDSKESYTSATGWQDFYNIEEIEMPIPVADGENFQGEDGFYYTCVSSDDLTCEVTWGGEKNTSGTDIYTGAITIPAEVTYQGCAYMVIGLGDSAFRQCEGLTSVVIPETVTYIGGTYVFSKCSSLTSVTIPESVTYIGDEAFYNCTALEEIILPNSVDSLGTYAFWTCSNLKKVTLPGNLRTIGQYTFYKCSVLADCILPQTLTTIGKDAFYQCDALEVVTLPDALTSLGDYAYYKCVGLKKLTLSKNITTWGQYTFEGCTALTEIEFPEGLVGIGNYAFSSCSSLESVEFNSDITSLGDNGFSNTGLKEVAIPGSVEEVNSSVFYNCSQLTKVTFEEGVASIGSKAFSTCPLLETIVFPESSMTTIGEQAFYNDSMVESLTIPASVTTTGNSAFYGMAKLSSLTFEEGSHLTTMGTNTFYKCAALKDVALPNSITSVGSGTFYYCSDLETVTLPENIEELAISTFRYCTSLKEVAVPEKVTVINNYAFDGCTSLRKVSLSNHITDLGQYTFQNDSNLVDVIALEDGVALNTSGVHIPDNIETMKISEFINCISLEEVTIPAAVTEFKNKVFQNCEKLSSVTCLNPEPALCGTQVFDGICAECVLYVLVGSKASYSDADTWKDFFDIVEMVEFSIETLAATDVTDTSAMLNASVIAAYNEPILERGFEYWAGEDDVQTRVSDTINDGEFSVTVDELMYGTTYTYRVYAIAESGTTYGEEFTFTTELYAPEVATLAATDVTDSSAVLNGEVEQGSEPINVKGFIYGADSTPNVITIIIVSEEDMTYVLEGLQSLTTYTYRAFVRTDSGTVYGEDVTFTTMEVDGISGISSGVNAENVEGIYTISGQKINALQKGVNIIRYADGTTKKVLVK